MKNCLIWGIAEEYSAHINQINYEVMKGNLHIEALISRDRFSSYLDGKQVISKFEIGSFVYDYIIVFNKARYKEIKAEAILEGVDEEKILDGYIFDIPYFDFIKYTNLLENRVTIISDDCFGAFVYNYLGMQFSSPFILFYFNNNNDYIKLLQSLDYYLEQPLCQEMASNVSTSQMPIGALGSGQDKILLYFNHYGSFEQAKAAWDRRIKRINRNNMLVKMAILNDDIAQRFDALPYEKKVGFYFKPNMGESIYYLPGYAGRLQSKPITYAYSFAAYVRNMKVMSQSCDFLKLLNGEKDFIREYDSK